MMLIKTESILIDVNVFFVNVHTNRQIDKCRQNPNSKSFNHKTMVIRSHTDLHFTKL